MIRIKSKFINELVNFEDYQGYEIFEDGTVLSYWEKTYEENGRISGSKIGEEPKRVYGSIDSKGYKYITMKDIYGKRRHPKIHRLVALAFLSNPDNKPQINHIDGNKENNSVKNLEWATNGENQKHAFKLGLNKPHIKDKNYQWFGDHDNCKKVRQLDLEGNEVAIHNSLAIAGRSVGKGYSTISKVCNGKGKTAHGFKWEFVE